MLLHAVVFAYFVNFYVTTTEKVRTITSAAGKFNGKSFCAELFSLGYLEVHLTLKIIFASFSRLAAGSVTEQLVELYCSWFIGMELS